MDTETNDMEHGTKPLPEHQWLEQLVGEWTTKTEMMMPDGSSATSEGTETCRNFGGLWALGSGLTQMPGGEPMEYQVGLGYDVSFKGYRGYMVMTASSHLWKYEGSLSDDGKVMTLNCEGPDMFKDDGSTAHYRDVITIIDADHRTLSSFGPGPDGNEVSYMVCQYSRA